MLRVHTTCPSCQTHLELTEGGGRVHPDCPPSPDPGDVLQRAFLAAAAAGDDAEADRLCDELDAYHHRVPQYLAAALAYAAWGWPVLAVRPGAKTPQTRHGLHDATTNPHRLRQWWTFWPDANVGLSTGAAFDVIDVDPAGLGWLADLRLDPDRLVEVHGVASTPRGGQHLYVLPTGSGNTVGLAAGVDYRGRGGYVLAPPSELDASALHGQAPRWPLRYDWLVSPSPALRAVSG